jgi:Ca2+-dependent lipid-binding protein
MITTDENTFNGDNNDDNETGDKSFKVAGQAVLAANTFSTSQPVPGSSKPSSSGLTPAQALTRVTGTIFDFEAEVPVFLRTPLVTLVATSDQVQQSIDATRPAFEQLMHWEILTASLYIPFGLWASWVIGYFGLGYGWVVVLMLYIAGAFKRDWKRLKGKIDSEASRRIALRRLENEVETVEWFNKFFEKFWVQMEPWLSGSIKQSIDSVLAGSKPTFLEDLSLSIFTLGSVAPRIESIRTIGRTAEDVHLMDVDLNFTPVDEDMVSKRDRELGDVKNSRIEVVAKLGKGIAVIPVPVLLAEIGFKGKVSNMFNSYLFIFVFDA